jgi:hypothetical protein
MKTTLGAAYVKVSLQTAETFPNESLHLPLFSE